MNPKDIIQVATDLQANSTKIEIVAMARSLGWKGDHARAPMLQLALFVATKLASGNQGQQFGQSGDYGHDGQQGGDEAPEGGDGQQGGDEGQQQQQPEGRQGGEGQQQQPQEAPQQGQQEAPQQPEGQQGQQEAPQQPEGQQGGEGQQQGEGQQGQQEAPQQPQQPEAPKPDHTKAPKWNSQEERFEYPAQQQQPQQEGGEGQQQEGGEGQQQEGGEGQQQEGGEGQQEPETPDANEFNELLAASGITDPHRLLQKVWLLAAKAKQNVMLVGPAASGKTMLSHQLAQLLRVPFDAISCTMGMSESQLTGWLLPIGDNGRFDYVPAPFVKCLGMPSVFMLDELDAADPNVLMLMNSVLSNGFISIPQKLTGNLVERHKDSIVIAGTNTRGTGADDLYTARAALDASTIDRFYPVIVDYDESYEHGLFNIGRKSRKKSPAWTPAAVPDQLGFDALRSWFFQTRKKALSAGLTKVISTRLASRLVAAVKAGVPVEEAKTDLLLGWTNDELARIGM